MHRKRFHFILSIAGMLALLAGTLPMAFSTAMENSKAGAITCPPLEPSLTQNPSYMKALPAQCREQLREADRSAQTLSAQTPLLVTGGPDGFGYTYDDTVAFNWMTATTDSGLTGDENSQNSFDIGFSFPFYGSSYSQLNFNTNGFVTFDFSSACCFWFAVPIPNAALPNNMIAPFWDDLVVSDGFNSGAIYYEKGGVAPDRYLLLEWRDVTTYGGTEPFSFEVVLYENGNILVQHQSLPTNYFASVGIENAIGDDGLQYHAGPGGLSPSKAILFVPPSGPSARVSVTPLVSGKFANSASNTNFPIQIRNTGSMGTDTYDLQSPFISPWPMGLYQDGCVTPLTDTDADTIPDTGPLAEGGEVTICVSFSTSGLSVGDQNSAVLTVTSSLDTGKTRNAAFHMVVPTDFVQVQEDYANAAMAFQTHGPQGSTTTYVTDDSYFANGLAVMRMPDGRYLYAWRKPDGNFQDAHSNIEYSILNLDGSFDLPVTQLTDNSGTGQTYDYSPAVAVAPNGNIGITWYRWIVDNNTGLFNYNIYFAMLSPNGTVLYSPHNVTENALWDLFDNPDVPHFFWPAIAATADNNFVLSWQEYRTDGAMIFNNDIWFSARYSNGTNLVFPTALSSDGSNVVPILNPLTGGDVILTYLSDGQHVTYSILDTNGVVSGPHIVPGAFSFQSTDAVMLSNGHTALAWSSTGPEVGYVILDEAYNITLGPVLAANTGSAYNTSLSVTHDEEDRIVMTWTDDDASQPTKLFYALANDVGTFIGAPTQFHASGPGVITSINGQGNAPILTTTAVLHVTIDIRPGSIINPISMKSKSVVPVAILSTPGFDAFTMVDKTSLTFGKTGDEASLRSCNTKRPEDINGDGLRDLLCHFNAPATGFIHGDTVGTLKGLTVDGDPFEGSDIVTILR